jgi:DNA-directed RNA polymerase specialized sigma24 family protein
VNRGSRFSGASPVAEWPRLLEAEVDYVYQTLQRCGASAAEIEDLVQEVFVVLLRRRASYDPSRPLRPWIAGVAFKAVLEWRRRNWRELPRGFVDARTPAGRTSSCSGSPTAG